MFLKLHTTQNIFQLKTDFSEKEKQINELQNEYSGLKEQLASAEKGHKAAITEQEKKFSQVIEEVGMKNTEVSSQPREFTCRPWPCGFCTLAGQVVGVNVFEFRLEE